MRSFTAALILATVASASVISEVADIILEPVNHAPEPEPVVTKKETKAESSEIKMI